MSKRKMFFRMITASLMRRRSRMLVALLAIAVGGTILSGLVTIYRDVPRQMGAQMRNYGANMIFVPAEADTKLNLELIDRAVSLIDPSLLVGVTPYRYETVRIHEQPVMVAATNFEGAKATSPYWLIDGEWPSGSNQLLVGQNIAETLGLKIGTAVAVVYTHPDADPDVPNFGTDMTVAGILETGGSEEDYVYMSLDDMSGLIGDTVDFEDERIDLAELSISASGAALTDLIEKIETNVPGVAPRLVKRVTASETAVLSKLQSLVLLVTIVVLILTMICVATTMNAVVTERRKEIGLRKALGASDQSIMAEFMGEGLLLGLIGGILGVILGFAFAQFVSRQVFSSSITLQPMLVPTTILASILVTGLACYVPVRSATEVDPALVLKGE